MNHITDNHQDNTGVYVGLGHPLYTPTYLDPVDGVGEGLGREQDKTDETDGDRP